MTGNQRGSLAAQLRPRLILTVAVMAVLLGVATVFAARTILYNQLDGELDAAQVRQGRGIVGGDRVPGIETPGMRAGTVITLLRGDGTALKGMVGDGAVMDISDTAALEMVRLVPGEKHSLDLDGLGRYRVEARDTRLGRVAVGLPTNDIDSTLVWLSVFAGSLSLVAIGATSLVTRQVLDTATRPLVELTNTADEVSGLELERGAVEVPRVAVGELPDASEVTRLATSFNRMLGRVEGALGAREASESKLRRFVADASHELRNPLAAIRGYAELAQRRPDTDDAAFAMARIGAESERMAKLVGDLLLLARLDSDVPVTPEPVDVVEVVLNAVSDAQASAPRHRWQLDAPPSEITVMANADQLHQVMVNLLGNARTHTPAGTTVSVAVRAEDGTAVIDVVDDGPGIPAEKQALVFERFTRVDDTRPHTSEKSTGLGLAIVRAVVQSFGGQASVESRPGRTCFSVRLPLAAPSGPGATMLGQPERTP